jgi:sugar phosphate isomerase/epimerase
MKLAYSTLACPGWTWEKAIDAALSLGYHGVEWRLVDGEMVSAATPAATIGRIRSRMQSCGLESCALDSSIQLAVPPGDQRRATAREGRSMLDLAAELGTRMLRLFIGRYPPATSEHDALQWVQDGLWEILPAAERAGVAVALEVHSFEGRGRNVDGTSDSSLCRRVCDAMRSPSLGILWDVGNPFDEGEPLAETWENVREHLLYVHLKDARRRPGGGLQYVPCGEGEIDLPEIVRLLRARRFDGWLSFEWEKKWVPELAEPEVALPLYVAAMRGLGVVPLRRAPGP